MTASAPKAGRCGAKKARGGYCDAHPVEGGTRCRRHGGFAQGWSSRLRATQEEGRRQVQLALDDPNLMDVRRPIALAETIVANTELVASSEQVEQLARRNIIRQVGPELVAVLREAADGEVGRELLAELLRPTDGDLAQARLELHERTMRLVGIYGKRQTEAVRAMQWAQVIRELTIPMFANLGGKLNAVVRKHVPPDRIDRALEDVKAALLETVGELSVVNPK